jgi:hypothetical protein
MKNHILVVAVGVAFLSTPSLAGKLNGADMYLLKGTCDKLVVGDEIYTSCAPGLLSTSYPNGRIGFHFSTQEGTAISFSGIDGENPTKDADVSLIDKVIINVKGGDGAEDFEADGECIYTNPFTGEPATVNCSGRIGDGRTFSAIFTTDGSKPE